MGGSNQPNIPKAPDLTKTYGQGVNVYSQYLPQLLAMEQGARGSYDPSRIAQQQALQGKFGTNQYKQMLSALKTLDPQFVNARSALGTKVTSGLNAPANTPYQKEALKIQGQTAAALNKNAPTAYTSEVNDLRTKLAGDVNLGTSLSPSEEQQIEQYYRGAQAAGGGGFGGAAATGEAYALGDRGQQLYNTRIGNLENSLQSGDVTSQNYQRLLGNATGSLSTLGDINTLNTQRQLGNVSNYLGMPTLATQTGSVPPVSPDRSSAYVNPNAGYLGAQYGLQNYQNQVAGAQLSAGQSSNPWLSSLSGSAAGASAGSVFGGYGTAAGALAGGLYGGLSSAYGSNTGYNTYGSDRRLKTGIKKVGTAPSGVNMYEFAYKHRQPQPRLQGAMSDDVEKKIPDAVSTDPATGFKQVDYSKVGFPMRRVA